MALKSKFRIQPAYGTRWVIERSDGRSCYGEIWRVIDYCESEVSAQDRLAVADGRMSHTEWKRRIRSRTKARMQAEAVS